MNFTAVKYIYALLLLFIPGWWNFNSATRVLLIARGARRSDSGYFHCFQFTILIHRLLMQEIDNARCCYQICYLK